jgi:hypothetical protein
MRLLCAVLGVAVFGALLVVALTLPSSSTGVVTFGVVDQVAIGGLGLILGLGIAALGRSRVDADAGEYAARAVEGLRALHAAARAQDPVPPPLLYDN